MRTEQIFSVIICLLIIFPAMLDGQNVLTTTDHNHFKTGSGSIILTAPPPPPCGTLTVSDIDGNVYNTVKIGTQCWMKRNLATTKFNDGTPIRLYAGCCGFEGDPGYDAWTSYAGYLIWLNKDTYGYHYNWFSIDNNEATRVASNGGKNICPFGWHVPNDADWITLFTHLTGSSNTTSFAGAYLKETGFSHWNSPNGDATNSSGFTALPGGVWSRGYYNYHTFAYFWSTTPVDATNYSFYYMQNANGWSVIDHTAKKFMGCTVRCLQN